jgi:hypothetical protein
MKTLALLILLSSFSLAGLPTPEEEITTLKAEYAKREAAAVRPVKDWLAGELAKKEKAFLADGKSEAAAAVARERAVMLLCSTEWTWDTKNNEHYKLTFRPDGTGNHIPKGPFKWELDGRKMTLIRGDGKTARVTLDLAALKYSGTGFEGVAITGSPEKD